MLDSRFLGRLGDSLVMIFSNSLILKDSNLGSLRLYWVSVLVNRTRLRAIHMKTRKGKFCHKKKTVGRLKKNSSIIKLLILNITYPPGGLVGLFIPFAVNARACCIPVLAETPGITLTNSITN